MEHAKRLKSKKVKRELDDEEWMDRLKKALNEMQDRCVACMVNRRKMKNDHEYRKCQFVGFWGYVSWKKGVKVDVRRHGPHCYCCHVPQMNDSLHPFNDKGTRAVEDCIYPDTTLALAHAIFMHEPDRLLAQRYFGVIWKDAKDFAKWLSSSEVQRNRTNTMRLIIWFVEKCWLKRD